MKYKKTATKSTKIETTTNAICYQLEQHGLRYERFNHYKPRYYQTEGSWGEIIEVENTGDDVGTGYAWIKYYYDDRKFGYIFVCCHLVSCETCTYNRYVTIYNYTDDIADSNIPGDVPVLATLPLPEDTDELDPTTLYYDYTEFTPIISGDEVCPICKGNGGIICTICNGSGYQTIKSKIAGRVVTSQITCPKCHGDKYIKEYHECTTCNGTGEIKTIVSIVDKQPIYGTKPCSTCQGTGEISIECNKCHGTGLGNATYGNTQSAYYFYMDKSRDEDGNLVCLSPYSKKIKAITDLNQIEPYTDNLYVKYNPDMVLDDHHKPDENPYDISDPSYSALDELHHLEFYKRDYTDNMGENYIPTYVATDIGTQEAAIANYATHCVTKTFTEIDDINGIMNYVLYKDKNCPILQINDDINFAMENWNIDYSFEDSTNNTYQLSAFKDHIMGSDYTSLDVSGGAASGPYSSYFIAGSLYPKNTEIDYLANNLDTTTYPWNASTPLSGFAMDIIANKIGNIEYGQAKTTSTEGDLKISKYNEILTHDLTDCRLGGQLTLTDFRSIFVGPSGETGWSAFSGVRNYISHYLIDKITVALDYTISNYDEHYTGDYDKYLYTESFFEKELDYDLVPIYPTVDELNDGAENEPIGYYKNYKSFYKFDLVTDDNELIPIPNGIDHFGIGARIKVYTRNPSHPVEPLYNQQTVFTSAIRVNPSIDFIIANNIDSNKTSYETLVSHFNLPYIQYDYNDYIVNDNANTNYPTNESCYNYYWLEYGSYINAFKWFTFDNAGHILYDKPDTFELHETYKNKYGNFITQHKLKSIYTKNEYPKDYEHTSPYNAYRLECPTCSGEYIDSISARCRTCAGSFVKQFYYYYECNDFRDASEYDDKTGHAKPVDLNTAIPTIDDIAPVTVYITDPATQEVKKESWPYVKYAAYHYYSTLETDEKYAEAVEAVKYNTVLFKYSGDVNRYYWWNGTKHIMVNMGYKHIYRTKVVTKDTLILEDDDGNIVPGENSMDFETFEVYNNDELVLYRVLAKLEDLDDIIGFYGYNLDTKKYQRIYMYNKHVFNSITEHSTDFNYFTVSATIIDADIHTDEPGHDYGEECNPDSLNEIYYYKYKTIDRISFDNLNFEVYQNLLEIEQSSNRQNRDGSGTMPDKPAQPIQPIQPTNPDDTDDNDYDESFGITTEDDENITTEDDIVIVTEDATIEQPNIPATPVEPIEPSEQTEPTNYDESFSITDENNDAIITEDDEVIVTEDAIETTGN